MKIYKYIYYASFLQSRRVNASPEILVYGYLSFIQTNHLIIVVNVFFILTRINIYYDILKLFLLGPITFYLINYYYFSKKGNGAKIIEDKSYSLGKYSFWLDIFGFASFLLVVFTYYLYKEF
jgi:hypothetical protein